MESLCVANGCGSKEVYRFALITYPTPLVCICSFCSSIPTFFIL